MRCPAVICILLCLAWTLPAMAAGDNPPAKDDPTPEPAAAALVGPPTPGKPLVKPVPDPVLAKRIRAGIVATKRPQLQHVRLRVERGVVTMDGTVRTLQEKALVEAVARTLPGVRDVKSNVKLTTGFTRIAPPGDRRSIVQMTIDEKLRKKVVRKLARLPGVRISQIQVEVYGGVAVVGGIVPSAEHVKRVRHSLIFISDLRAYVLNLQVEDTAP